MSLSTLGSETGTKNNAYRPLEVLLLRAPLLSIEVYRSLANRSWAELLAFYQGSPHIRAAISVGSPSLSAALESGKNRCSEKSLSTLLKYLIRMATRPTPYGLFAGVSVIEWGPETAASLSTVCPTTRTRPDMEWLFKMVFALERRPDVLKHVRLISNSSVLLHAGRYRLAEPLVGEALGSVSIRATAATTAALETARKGTSYATLESQLSVFPNANPGKVAHLIAELVAKSFLFTDLRPPLTTSDPSRYLLQVLSQIPSAQEDVSKLRELLSAANAFDTGYRNEPNKLACSFVASTGLDGKAKCNVQVDSALALSGTKISHIVASEAARAAELLLRLSPPSRRRPALAAYQAAFESKYGIDREVRLLELLDDEIGLGSPKKYLYRAVTSDDSSEDTSRSVYLLQLACSALRDRQLVVNLDSAAVERLDCRALPSEFPLSLDLFVSVAASSTKAIDRGEFILVVGPSTGAQPAGRTLGRFADLFGSTVHELLAEVAAITQHAYDEHKTWAELVYLPTFPRSSNVVIRPPVQDYEIVVGTTAGVLPENIVPLDEITVGVRVGKGFRLIWRNKELKICAGHMLNPANAPAACLFLSETINQGVVRLGPFDWGPASMFPFLPRVAMGRIVLHPAQWRVDTSDAANLAAASEKEFGDLLINWRQTWQVPRHVHVTEGDNRLLLDLEDGKQQQLLQEAMRRSQHKGPLIIQEALPAIEDTWLEDPGARFFCELAIPMVRRDLKPAFTSSEPVGGNSNRPHFLPSIRVEDRVKIPGSDWLFAKLYSSKSVQDEVIAGELRLFCNLIGRAGASQSAFFSRYADPDTHVRLRVRGDPSRLVREVLPKLTEWTANLVKSGRCSRVCLDTYDREIERYGGLDAMTLAEQIFAADSQAVAELLYLETRRRLTFDRTVLAVITVDDLLGSLGLTETARLTWYSQQVGDRRPSASRYRELNPILRELLIAPCKDGSAHADWTEILVERRRNLEGVARRLRILEESAVLSRSFDDLCTSYVHMHQNRLLGVDRAAEQLTLALALRAREGIAATDPDRS